MKELIKKNFLEESEVLLKSEMVTLVGGSDSSIDPPLFPVCKPTCAASCAKSCMNSCSQKQSS